MFCYYFDMIVRILRNVVDTILKVLYGNIFKYFTLSFGCLPIQRYCKLFIICTFNYLIKYWRFAIYNSHYLVCERRVYLQYIGILLLNEQ